MLYKIGFFCLFCFSLFSAEHVYLKSPDISRENIIGTNVGIRPYRKSGVRLEAEWLQDKLIIHNYGYGGAGLTLSFGGAKEVLNILDNNNVSSGSIAVLGAGVVGLATAYDLLEKGYDVHIYAEDWVPNLTSNVAAGIWTPLSFPSAISEEKKKFHHQLLKFSESRFLKSTGDSPEFVGVKLIYYYSFKTKNSHETIKTKQKEEVIVHFDNGVIKNGKRAYEIGIDGQLFIDDLYSKVKNKGAILHQHHFENLDDLLKLKEPIIINCMSIGSLKLFNDQDFLPVRGQIIYFKQQDSIDYLLAQNIDKIQDGTNIFFFFIYPWSDRMILGGVYEIGKDEAIITPDIIDKIIENAKKCLSDES